MVATARQWRFQLKVFLVGRVALETDEGVIDEARFPRQGRLLFAYLVAEQGRPVPRDELAAALWEDVPPATWEKGLSVIVSKLRGLLADAGVDGANVLTSAFGCYRLELPEGTWVDLIAAENAVRESEEALAKDDLEQAKSAAALAASIARRPFLPGEVGVWVEARRRELADVLGRALSALAEACMRLGEAAEAAKWAEQALALAPFRELGYRRLMEAHVAAGNRAEALQVYERCRQLLAEELGAYPSPETESIYRGLLGTPSAHDAAADAPEPLSPREPAAQHAAITRVGRQRLVLVLACGAIAAAVTATVVLLARGGSSATALAVSADSVGIFQLATARLAGEISVGASPSAVMAGAGSIWVANRDDHSVSRIDPVKQVVIQTIQVGNDPAGVAFGGGFVWVTNGLDGTLSEISPQTNTAVKTIPDVGNGPAGLAVDGRYVWVANSNDGTVARVDSITWKVRNVTSVGAGAEGVAVGDGSVWVTNQSTGTVTRIDPRTGSVIEAIQAGSGASAVTVGPGSVWVANSLDGTVTRIDPVSNAVRAVIPVGDGPNGIAVAPRAVWVSNELAGTLTKIDPARGIPVQTRETGNRPQGVVFASGSLFVAVRASGTSHRGGTLTMLTSSDAVPALDPALAYGPQALQVLVVTNDGLTGFRRVGGSGGTRLVPDLAVSIPTPTDGGLTYSFHLRPGIRYSTGAPVRPQDFRRALERSLVQGDQSGYYSHIVGAAGCLAKPKKSCNLRQGIVVDSASNTISFHLSSPDSDFVYKLALASADAVPVATPLNLHGQPVPATGPYMIASFEQGRAVRLVRNPRFQEWSPAAQPAGFPDAIVIRLGGSPDAHALAVERGAADLASDYTPLSPAVLAAAETRYAGQLKVNPLGITNFIVLNTRIPPFNNLRARQALNFAVDRQRLTALTVGQSLGVVTCQVLPPNFDGYRRNCPYTADPNRAGAWTAPDLARARKLVRLSGTAGEAVTFWIPRWIHFGAAAGRYVVSVLDSLGYKARFRFAPNPYAVEDKLGLQAGFGAWYADFATPDGFIGQTLTCSSYNKADLTNNTNFAEFCDPAIDREIERAESLQAGDPVTARQLWAMIDSDIVAQAPWVPFADGDVLEVVSTRLGNYQFNPQWLTLLDQLWVR
jgi:peptide/nickel transport system substrate-binding protein